MPTAKQNLITLRKEIGKMQARQARSVDTTLLYKAVSRQCKTEGKYAMSWATYIGTLRDSGLRFTEERVYFKRPKGITIHYIPSNWEGRMSFCGRQDVIGFSQKTNEREDKVMAIKKKKNGVTRMWDGSVLNDVLKQLRKLQGVTVARDASAGTVKVTGKSKAGKERELLWGLQKGRGGPWIIRYDRKLFL